MRSLEKNLSGLWSVLDVESGLECDNCGEHDDDHVKENNHQHVANGTANNICDL